MLAKYYQNIIVQMKDGLSGVVGVVDDRGYIVACSDASLIDTRMDGFDFSSVPMSDKCFASNGKTFRALASDNVNKVEFVAFVDGTSPSDQTLCHVASVAFNEVKSIYDEKHNKAAFVKNIISDNILPGDVYVRAKELNFATDNPRAVLLVRQVNDSNLAAIEVLRRLYSDKNEEFVFSINETDIVVIKLLKKSDDSREAYADAKVIQKQLSDELGIDCLIGISTCSHHLRELADRYKEAQVAIEIGSVFDSEKTIMNYESLGLGRIIYQLPTTLCEMFLNEVFKKNPIETLDEDTIDTINKFFENNLNVSETSRKLYVHRNTLVYRLEKIKKITGLDLREFDHAIIFKVAMMVKMYLDSLNNGRK